MSQITSKCIEDLPPHNPGMSTKERISLMQRTDVLEIRCMKLRYYCACIIHEQSPDFKRADKLHDINYSEYKQIAFKIRNTV